MQNLRDLYRDGSGTSDILQKRLCGGFKDA